MKKRVVQFIKLINFIFISFGKARKYINLSQISYIKLHFLYNLLICFSSNEIETN